MCERIMKSEDCLLDKHCLYATKDDGKCPNNCNYFEVTLKEKSGNLGEARNAVLADVLAEIEKRCYDTGENFLSIDRDVLRDELSKYFS